MSLFTIDSVRPFAAKQKGSSYRVGKSNPSQKAAGKMLFFLVAMAMVLITPSTSRATDTTKINDHPDKVTLKLPRGFNSTLIAEGVGKNRHIAVNKNGDLYVKVERLKDGKGIIVLRQKAGTAKADVVNSFGDFAGTGIVIKDGYVYATSDDDVYRYKLNGKNEIDPAQTPERIVKGLVNQRQHAAKTIALDNAGNLYVNIGAPSNSCQVKDREKGSPGQDPCRILETSGGIWQFKADKKDQSYQEGVKYSTGIRNAVALDWNSQANDLFALQHGRDGLFQMFPEMYNAEQGAELPAEEMFRVKKGSDFGWPYCYFDLFQQKKVLAPEYGGDKTNQGRCEGVDTPVVSFPGHWAPNDLIFYTGDQFPAKYRNGAFIAFHGSWNRAPQKQAGYKVVFVPFKDGNVSGEWEVFAEGFTGADEITSPGQAETRPCGLAQAPDGSLYISDSVKGNIWKINYTK